MSQEPKKVDRRSFLYIGLGAVALIAIGAAAYIAMNPPVVTQTTTVSTTVPTTVPTTSVVTTTVPTTTTVTTTPPHTIKPGTTLDFWRWSYASDFLSECLKRFEDHYGIKVNQLEVASAEYHSKMLSLFAAKTSVEVCAVRDEYLEEWRSAGWIKPLDDVVSKSEIDEYKKALAGPSRERAFYKGSFWGLPYYTGTYVWYGNKNLIKKAGFDSFPKTFSELYEQCQAVSKIGVKYPLSLWPGHAMEVGVRIMGDCLRAGIYPVFDENWEPLWRDNDKLIGIWKFYQDAWKNGWINPADWTEETSYMIGEFAAERNCFGSHVYYQLRSFNDPKTGGAAAGYMEVFQPPAYDIKDYPARGIGYARIYAISTWCEYPEESWLLIKFLGGKDWEGKYWMPKQWFLKYGLGFGYPELWSDPEIVESAKSWLLPTPDLVSQIEARAVAHPHAIVPWASDWMEAARPLFQDMVMGKLDPKTVQCQIADKWVELRKKYTGK